MADAPRGLSAPCSTAGCRRPRLSKSLLTPIAHVIVLATATLTLQAQGQATVPDSIALSRFRELSWLIGRWRGSGRWSPAFYEQYRFRDDSTIAMTAYTDSTFRSETPDSSVIEWRRGRVRTRTPRATYEVIDLAPGRIRFRRVGAADGGHQFTSLSEDEWAATIFPRGTSKDTTVFRMRRVPEVRR